MAIPRIKMDSYEVQVDPASGEGQVNVRNAGRVNLTISDLASSCSCASAKVLDKLLEPGKSTQIVVKIVGEADATVAVFSNDPQNGRVFVNFSRRGPGTSSLPTSHE